MNRMYLFAIVSAAIPVILFLYIVTTSETGVYEDSYIADFDIRLDSNSIDIKRGEVRNVNMYVLFPSSRGLKGNVIIEPEYIRDTDAYKQILVIADRYHIDIEASKYTIIKHIVIQLTISAASDAKEGYYIYKVGLTDIEGVSHSMYLNISVK
jgi:hypothetical protein